MSATSKYRKIQKKARKADKLAKKNRKLKKQNKRVHRDATTYHNAVVEQVHQEHREANPDWRFVRWAGNNIALVGILTGVIIIAIVAGVMFSPFGPKLTASAIIAVLLTYFGVLRVMKLANPRNHEGQS